MAPWSKIRNMLNISFGKVLSRLPVRYFLFQVEKRILYWEQLEQRTQLNKTVENLMIKPTDIHEHIATLYMLSIELNLTTILELGTRGGESTIALLEAAKRIGGEVHSIDINPCLKARVRVKEYDLEEYWTFVQGNDLDLEWSKPIHHLFIDTSHTYKQTMHELVKYEPYVKPGGIITMHDTVSHPEVAMVIDRYFENKENFRIYKYFNNNGLAVIFKGHLPL